MEEIARNIPTEVGGWTAAGSDRTYDRETLFDYMNGGAEIYLAFDFRGVLTRRYHAEDAGDPALTDEIVLDIYDMGSSAEAFGVFSCDVEDEPAGIGQGSEYGYGLLRFWQGRFFVSILTSGSLETAEAAILELGRTVADVLGPTGPEPELLALLPSVGRLDNRTGYFHGNVTLNVRFFIASDNILGLDRDTDCAIAEYERGETGKVTLLIVRYPDPDRAAAAESTFRTIYLSAAGESGEEQMDDGGWTRVMREETVLALVFDAPTVEIARELQAEIRFP